MAEKVKATTEQVEKIIDCLISYPVIWDINSKLYSNRDANKRAWEQLASEVELPVNDLKRSYDSIRRRFREVSF